MKFFCFSHKHGLPFLVPLIRSSPNLEKLQLVMEDIDWPDEEDLGSFTLEDYSDIMFEHLNELEIIHFGDTENELDFVKLVLAKSHVLKKVRINPHRCIDEDESAEILKILLGDCTPCASPVVDISVGKF
ncbi:putative FBD domain-containing protein [Helianthus anomalus]